MISVLFNGDNNCSLISSGSISFRASCCGGVGKLLVVCCRRHHITSISSSLCQYLVLILIQVDCTVIFYVWKFKFTFFSLSLDYTYYLTYVFVAKWWCEDNTVHDVVVLWLMINLVPEFDFQKQKQKRFEKNTWLVTK